MTLWKDTKNGIHDDMNGEAVALLPIGCVPITQGEVDAIHLADKAKNDAEILGRENYKALIRREADALDAAGEPYKAIKHLKLIGE